MKLVGTKDEFEVYFDTNQQEYKVYYKGLFFLGDKYKFSDVKCYLN